MNIIYNPKKDMQDELLKRPSADNYQIGSKVQEIINAVRREGDAALKRFSQEFDGAEIDDLTVSQDEIKAARKEVRSELQDAVQLAKKNIEIFHKVQLRQEDKIETIPGVTCWRKSVPIEKAGLYIPGGTAPLFSTVLMLAVPAALAGCKEIILCTPAGKDGKIHPAVLYAADTCGVSKIFKAGGAQAVAAMAYGTESIPAVYKIYGPGNQYVTTAKMLVNMDGIAIDMPAGPSELLVIADENADPEFVAADLLSQAEHGIDSQVILITNSKSMAENAANEISRQLQLLPRKETASASLKNSIIIVLENLDEAFETANRYAPEHLILNISNPENYLNKIQNAGSVFVGPLTPESAGDYASGTNHTLPTNGYARSYSGVSIDSFMKKITFQQISGEGLKNIGPAVETMAEAEGLTAHKNAVSVRLKHI